MPAIQRIGAPRIVIAALFAASGRKSYLRRAGRRVDSDKTAFTHSLSPEDWLLGRFRGLEPKWSLECLRADADLDAWRTGLAADLRAALALDGVEPVDPDVKLLDRYEDRGITVERILFDSEPGVTVPGLILLPHTLELPQPAVIVCPDRGRGKASALLQPLWSDPDEPDRSLVRRLLDENLIVATLDPVGSGERSAPELPQIAAGGWLGRPLLGRWVRDVLQLIDFLDDRQEVDSKRFATVGFGSGGAVALHAMALDGRLRVGVVGGMLASNADRLTALAADGWQRLPELMHLMAPGLATLADVPDIASLCAPQPLLMLHAIDDPACPIDAARDCAALIAQGYARLQGKGTFEAGFLPEIGSRSHEATREFLVRHLRAQYV
jgi:predicted esterase